MTRLAGFVLRHRRLVIVFWLLLLVAGGAGSGQLSHRLKVDFSLPGHPGYETAKTTLRDYGNGAQTPPSILTVTAPAGETAKADAATIAKSIDRVRAAAPQMRVV